MPVRRSPCRSAARLCDRLSNTSGVWEELFRKRARSAARSDLIAFSRARAAVALRPGTSATPDQLRDYVKERVAPYKYPRVVWILDELPKGATGKILKRAIDKHLVQPLTGLISTGQIEMGDIVNVCLSDTRDALEFSKEEVTRYIQPPLSNARTARHVTEIMLAALA